MGEILPILGMWVVLPILMLLVMLPGCEATWGPWLLVLILLWGLILLLRLLLLELWLRLLGILLRLLLLLLLRVRGLLISLLVASAAKSSEERGDEVHQAIVIRHGDGLDSAQQSDRA